MLFTLMCFLSDDLGSYMYQSVGHDDVHLYVVCQVMYIATCIRLLVKMMFTLMCVLSDEIDSYMYQTVGQDCVYLYVFCQMN